MDKNIVDILNESIRQELLVSEYYSLFETTFQEDMEFWYKLNQEELKHSATLKAERDDLSKAGLLPAELVHGDFEILKKQNLLLSEFFEELKGSTPSREQAFSIAYALERTMIETIYESCLAKYPETRALNIFQYISGDEKMHIERIIQYASENDIIIDKSVNYFLL